MYTPGCASPFWFVSFWFLKKSTSTAEALYIWIPPTCRRWLVAREDEAFDKQHHQKAWENLCESTQASSCQSKFDSLYLLFIGSIRSRSVRVSVLDDSMNTLSVILLIVNGLIVRETTQNIFCWIALCLKIKFSFSVSFALSEVIVTQAGINEAKLRLFWFYTIHGNDICQFLTLPMSHKMSRIIVQI